MTNKELTFVCDVCGGETLCCEEKTVVKNIVIMEKDGSVSLEEMRGYDDEGDCDGEIYTFYCDDCKKDILTGTLGELEDMLRDAVNEEDAAENNICHDDKSAIKLYALVTNQGTAASETCLCMECFYAPGNIKMARESAKGGVPRQQAWHDVTANEALHCIVCGAGKSEDKDG